MNISLRARLTLWFGLVMAISLTVFGALTYTSISTELSTGLDVSLNKVVQGLDITIRAKAEETKEEKPTPHKSTKKRLAGRNITADSAKDDLAFLRKDSTGTDSALRTAIRPLIPSNSEGSATDDIEDIDPVWAAIYEYVILNPRNFMIQIMDSTGVIVYRSDNLGEDYLHLPDMFLAMVQDSISQFTTVTQKVRERDEDQSIRLAVGKSRSAYIIAGYPLDEIQTPLQEFYSTLILLIPAVLIVSTLGGWILAKASLRPVDEITKTVQDITASNLSRRLPEPKSNDEIRRLSETLNDMISRLESSFDQIRQFTGDASHELRTPLTILTGELELALRSQKTPQEYQEILSSCMQEVLRLSRVVEYLLLLSRADMGKIALQTERLDLNEILADLADAATVLGSQKTIYIIFRQQSEPAYVMAEYPKLYQMFLNLVDNAVKYTPERGTISISTHKEKGLVEVRVRDTGIGISAEHQKKIFNRFYRVDKARSRELGGAGLGLSIVQWTVNAHGGTIHVQSELGRGSTFTVRFPLASSEKTVATSRHVPNQPERTQRTKGRAFDHLPKFMKKGRGSGEKNREIQGDDGIG